MPGTNSGRFTAVLTIVAYALFGEYLPFGHSRWLRGGHKGPVDASLQEIMKNSEGRLDPRAVRQEDIEAVRELAESYRMQEEKNRPQLPRTDVAPPPRAVQVGAREHPYQRLAAAKMAAPPQYRQKRVLPTAMNTARPPRWNKTIAAASRRPEMPHPFEAPPIAVNPERGAK